MSQLVNFEECAFVPGIDEFIKRSTRCTEELKQKEAIYFQTETVLCGVLSTLNETTKLQDMAEIKTALEGTKSLVFEHMKVLEERRRENVYTFFPKTKELMGKCDLERNCNLFGPQLLAEHEKAIKSLEAIEKIEGTEETVDMGQKRLARPNRSRGRGFQPDPYWRGFYGQWRRPYGRRGRPY